jgi:hypothetical protein
MALYIPNSYLEEHVIRSELSHPHVSAPRPSNTPDPKQTTTAENIEEPLLTMGFLMDQNLASNKCLSITGERFNVAPSNPPRGSLLSQPNDQKSLLTKRRPSEINECSMEYPNLITKKIRKETACDTEVEIVSDVEKTSVSVVDLSFSPPAPKLASDKLKIVKLYSIFFNNKNMAREPP